MAGHRWILAGLVLTGTLGLAGAALRVMTSVAPGPLGQADWLTYGAPAAGGAQALTLRASGGALELVDDASQTVLQSRPLAGLDGVAIQGAPGNVDDTLTVDLSGGPLALPGGIHFDGGAGGFDTLVLTGGDPAPGSYQATGAQAGILTQGGTRVVFSNLEPVTNTAASPTFVISGTAAGEAITIGNGGLGCLGGCQLTKVSSPTFESVAFAHKISVTVKGLAGADTFTLNNSLPATGLSQLTLDAGGNAGDVIGITQFNLPAGTLVLTKVISVSQSGVLAVANLAVQAAGQVSLGNFSNQVTTMAGATTGSGSLFGFASAAPTLTVGTVQGLSGLSTANGPVQFDDLTLGSTLVVSQGIHTSGGPINLFADHLNLNAPVDAGAGVVYLDNETFSEPIELGTKSPTRLSLLQTELNRITASRLLIGNFGTDTGGLTVTADLAAPPGWSTLELRQDAAIEEVFSATVSVPNLALLTHSGEVNFGANQFGHVSTLAGATQGGAFSYVGAGHISIGTVGGLSGISTAGGSLFVSTRSGGLTVHQPVFSGAGTLQLFADENAGPSDNIVVDAGVVVSATNDIFLVAGDQINLQAGSVVAAGGAGHVGIDFSSSDTDNIGGGYFAGSISAAHNIPQAAGGNADETLTVDFQAGAALPNDLLYDGGNGLNNVIVSDAGALSPHEYFAAGAGVSRDFASLIHLSRVQNVTVIGGSGADQFGGGPDAGVTLHFVGGLPGVAVGDELSLNFISTHSLNPSLAITSFDARGASGQWSFSNRQPVTFSGIDTFDNLSLKVYLPLTRR